MKTDFLILISETDKIWMKLTDTAILACDIDYSNIDFITWKYGLLSELFNICCRRTDDDIKNMIEILESPWRGWEGKIKFDELKKGLKLIESKVEYYYEYENKGKGVENNMKKIKKVFISHSSDDSMFAEPLARLFEEIGLNENSIFCSSIPRFGIRGGKDIYVAIKNEFKDYEIHMVYLLSDNYYRSAACLNEMGAAWMTQNNYTVILLPGFEYKKIEGAINPRQIAISFNEERRTVKSRLNDLKDDIITEFDLPAVSANKWEEKRDDFLDIVYEEKRNV